MPKTSVLIPARNEPYLVKTIEDVFQKAAGEIEVIAVLESYWPEGWQALAKKYTGRLHTVHHGQDHEQFQDDQRRSTAREGTDH